MFKNLFGGKKEEPKNYGPKEPVFPGELFAITEITDEEGFYAIANINQSYENYPNKKYFPWCVLLTVEYEEKNDDGLPTDKEAEVLNNIEDKIESYVNQKHKVHFIGRVTRKDFRDVIFYIDFPSFNQQETNQFMDEINAIRRINFRLDKDPEWNFVSGLLK